MNSIHALGGDGGFISVPSTSTGNFITVSDSAFSDIDATGNGGTFNFLGAGDV